MTALQIAGQLRKMTVSPDESWDGHGLTNANYQLRLGDESVSMNALLGEQLTLSFTGEINCCACGKTTKKSFSQGYCYPCFTRLAECDTCIMSPEKCHYHLDTCRDNEWAHSHCMQDHIIYLANSSGLKVGITRGTQVPTRWFDQGASQAIPFIRVSTRYQSGLLEDALREWLNDRTNWQAMLKHQVEVLDMVAERNRVFELADTVISSFEKRFGLAAIQRQTEIAGTDIQYPVLNYPSKVSSLSFDKTPSISGKLQGIKGQYLILDTGVINIRRYTGYQVEFKTD